MSEQTKSQAASNGETKNGKVIALLKRKNGATLEDLVAATGWLPHSARATMTGMKKKGHAIERNKVDGVSRYSIVKSA